VPKGGSFGRERSFARIQIVNEHLVQSEIARDRELLRWITTMQWPCGASCRLLFTLEPVCWMNVAGSPSEPSSLTGNDSTLPPL
jgi:hypothetical protein